MNNSIRDLNHYVRTPLSIFLGIMGCLRQRPISSIKDHSPSQGSFKKILLIEDNPLLQFFHKQMLLKMNCQVTVANNAEESFWFLERRYDLILLDIGLPGMDGIQLAQIIRSGDSVNRYTTICALTAYTDQETVQNCLMVGINKILSKPISFEKLAGFVNKRYELV